jgi:hypothetical protein
VKSQEETGTEMSSGVLSHQGGPTRGGPAPPMCEGTLDSVSYPFSSRDFSYLAKTIKIVLKKFNANLFLLELLPIPKRTLQVPAYCPG